MEEPKRTLNCLRCGAEMRFRRRKDFTTNAASLLFCDDGPLLDLYACPACGKMELFEAKGAAPPPLRDGETAPLAYETAEDGIVCPQCGKHHDPQDDACPLCGLPREYLEGMTEPPSPPPEPPQAEKPLHYVKRRGDRDPWD